MQEKRSRWARWLCVLVLGVGLVLANLPGDSQKEEAEEPSKQISLANFMSGNADEVKAGEMVTQALGREVEPEVQLFFESAHETDETTKKLPSSSQKSIRLLTGRQHKVEKFNKDGLPHSKLLSSSNNSDYLNETTCEKWEVVSDTQRHTESRTVIESMRIVVWTSRELELSEQSKVTDLLEFSLQFDRERGDAIRFEVRKK